MMKTGKQESPRARAMGRSRWITTGAMGIAMMVPGTAPAQEQEFQLEEIIVTAQRRSESLQDVAISAQIFSQEALAQQHIHSISSLAETIPSIHVKGSGRSSTFFIRGTGSGESQSFDQSVGTFIDDIYHGRSRLSEATFLDLHHVEVLKGPQSTFFGNNAIAGAFNITTVKPGDEFEGFFRGLLSPKGGNNSGQYAAEAAVTAPISEELSLRVAAIATGQRGYLRNIVTGEYAGNQDNKVVRATLRYRPTENVDVSLKGEYGRGTNEGGLILRGTNCAPQPPFVAAGFCAMNLANGPVPSLRSNEYIANDGNFSHLKTYETVLKVDYHLDDLDLTSVTGLTGYRYLLQLDNDGTPVNLLNVEAPERYRQFSQEFRVASPTGGTFEYLAGAYFQSDTLNIQQSVSYNFLTPNLSAPAAFAALRPYLPLGQRVTAKQTEELYSLFGSLTWNLSDDFSLNGGLRGSIVKRDFDWDLTFGTASRQFGGINPIPDNLLPLASRAGIGTAGTVKLDRKDDALMPSVRAQYKMDPDMMAYASYGRGFKAGGFSVAEISANPANYPFAPEYVDAYEAGLKSELLNRRMMLNLAVFRNDFSDLQVVIQGTNATGALVNFVRNAAASRSQGVELGSQWIISPNFRLSADVTYLDSKFRTYRNAGPTYDQQLAGQTVQDLSGHRTLYAPRWSGTTSATLTLPVGESMELTTQLTAILSSRYQTYSTDDRLTVQPGYGRFDARISLDSTDGTWGVDLIGKNLTNTLVRTFSGYYPTARGSLVQDREQFRNIALQVRSKF